MLRCRRQGAYARVSFAELGRERDARDWIIQDSAASLLGSKSNGQVPGRVLDVLGHVQQEVRRAKPVNGTEQA